VQLCLWMQIHLQQEHTGGKASVHTTQNQLLDSARHARRQRTHTRAAPHEMTQDARARKHMPRCPRCRRRCSITHPPPELLHVVAECRRRQPRSLTHAAASWLCCTWHCLQAGAIKALPGAPGTRCTRHHASRACICKLLRGRHGRAAR